MQNLTGKSIGRYQILEMLGEGGMANVYKAYDTRLDRDVAVKVIRVDSFPSTAKERIMKRFEREARSQARLSHPNIVKVYDFGIYNGAPFLVMEYLSGGTLRDLMGKPFEWKKAVSLIIPIAQALGFAHKMGVLHRDVKPANIMLSADGQPMLSDFGIAKLLGEQSGHTLTGVGVGVGTPEYMAPEQGLGKDLDGRADVYSLGVLLYELVTGRTPFQADTPLAVLLKQVNDPLPRPAMFGADIPESVEQVIYKALAKNPEDRFMDMGAFASELQKLLPVEQTPVKKPQVVQKRPDKPERIAPIARTYQYLALNERSRFPQWRKWIIGIGGLILTVSIITSLVQRIKPVSQLPKDTAVSVPKMDPTQKIEISPTTSVVSQFKSTSQTKATGIVTMSATKIITPEITKTLPPQPTATSEIGIGSTQIREKDGMVMVYVPAGEFIMGSMEGEKDESPMHKIQLSEFWIDKTEVSYSQYLLCVKEQICPKNPYEKISRISKLNYPVVGVEWDQADSYCKWAGGKLPTEAQWEKAARGMDGRKYPWGNQNPTTSYANFNNKKDTLFDVNKYQDGASPFGILNMAGNVWEWVSDWYDEDYYSISDTYNPEGPLSGQYKVIRGGSSNNSPDQIRTSNRERSNPNFSLYYGFRCVLDS